MKTTFAWSVLERLRVGKWIGGTRPALSASPLNRTVENSVREKIRGSVRYLPPSPPEPVLPPFSRIRRIEPLDIPSFKWDTPPGMIRKGKIGRLPHALRERLNQRLNPSQIPAEQLNSPRNFEPLLSAPRPQLQSHCNCTKIAANPQQLHTIAAKTYRGGGGDPKHEATQPGGTANWRNRIAKPPGPVIVPFSRMLFPTGEHQGGRSENCAKLR